MSYFEPITQDIFNLGDLSTFQARDVTSAITTFDVSLSLDNSSQISVGVVDPGFTMASANYFQVRRDIFYRNIFFEISAVSVQRSEAVHPLYSLECRSKAIQLMKRDKKPEAYRGMTAYDFASAIAKRFQLKFVGEKTTKKQSIVKGKSRNADDSVWTVLRSLADEQKFLCFESEGTLFFCSETFLLGKWGDPKCSYGSFKFIPFFYPYAEDKFFKEFNSKYILLEMPEVRRSDDDIKAADGSILVDRFNGVHLRPGMTIYLGGIPDFEAFYIITDVQFKEGSPEPVRVSFRLPVDPSKETISTSTAKGSSNTAGTPGTNLIAPPVPTPITITTIASGLSVAGARAYARKALEYDKYRGPNALLIINTVASAVDALVRRPGESVSTFVNRVSTIQKEIDKIGRTLGLSESDKDGTAQILIFYLGGKKLETLGAAGGVSSAAYTQTYDSVRRVIDSGNSALSASTTSTSTSMSVAGASGGSAFFPNTPTPTMPPSVKTDIETYIDKFSPSRSTADERKSAKTTAVARAKRIFEAPTASAKSDLYRSFYRIEATNAQYTMGKAIYNAIVQEKVIKFIYPISGLSGFSRNIPASWPIQTR